MKLVAYNPAPWVPTEAEALAEDPHLYHRGFIATSRTNERIKRFCCDNCGRHHWGEWITYQDGPWGPREFDFEWKRPDGTPYAGDYPC